MIYTNWAFAQIWKVCSWRIYKYVNKEVSLEGWVYNVRRSGKIGFLTFRDGFDLLQCIVSKNDIGEEEIPDYYELFKLYYWDT